MAETKPDDGTSFGAGGCKYQTNGAICERTASRDCAECGWNPDNGVREWRVAKAMREYRRKANAGNV